MKEESKNKDEILIKEIDEEVDGKMLSKQGIKDIGCTSTCLFLTTGNVNFFLNFRKWRSNHWESFVKER